MNNKTTGEYTDTGCYHDWENVGPVHLPIDLFHEIAKRNGFKHRHIEGNDSWWVSKTEPMLHFVFKISPFQDRICLKCGILKDEKAEWINAQENRLKMDIGQFERQRQRREKAARLYEEVYHAIH